MRSTTLAAAVPLLLGVLLGAPAAALAHAQLRRADPPVGGTVHTPPTRVELAFSEAVEPRFSTILVTDAVGTRVDKGGVEATPGDPRRLAVSLGPVPPGTYTVIWHAVSVDTHKTEGRFSFTVAP